MPKISAATVADHREQQRRALVQAARELLGEGGDADRVTFGAVAERAGLARNSVYRYFPDSAALFAAVVADATPRWTAHITALMDAAETPADKIAAHALAQLELVRDGEHRIARALAAGRDRAALRHDAAQAHRGILEPLVRALTELGDDDPEQTAVLLQGLVNAATLALESGADYTALSTRTQSLVRASLAAVTAA
ncbi:TetR/AcrR family transcriptional regulator [Actinomadura harenae]|uniref:TetR/AcrR family transcriptional regulator n=1 Tax=Actinomadura harenae TaxID=2483351 RepID=A0A3M2M087_9ACTN|nr:TetR/AcrR family transcriptional regulator [Actinomadura harenae]RMI42842.1 TetR/AcrR family transcriptional regulator [Actinomadura harenae]